MLGSPPAGADYPKYYNYKAMRPHLDKDLQLRQQWLEVVWARALLLNPDVVVYQLE